MSDLLTIKIGPFDIALVEMGADDAKKHYGSFVETKQEIQLRKDFATEKQRVETLLHELLHAVWNERCVAAKDGEEKIITKMSIGLAALIRDNPELFESIIRALK